MMRSASVVAIAFCALLAAHQAPPPDWDEPQRVARVWLFDRPNTEANITSGMLLFSDGSTIRVGELPAGAMAAKEVSFPAKQIRWMAFLVDAVSETTQEVGLAEIAVFRAR